MCSLMQLAATDGRGYHTLCQGLQWLVIFSDLRCSSWRLLLLRLTGRAQAALRMLIFIGAAAALQSLGFFMLHTGSMAVAFEGAERKDTARMFGPSLAHLAVALVVGGIVFCDAQPASSVILRSFCCAADPH